MLDGTDGKIVIGAYASLLTMFGLGIGLICFNRCRSRLAQAQTHEPRQEQASGQSSDGGPVKVVIDKSPSGLSVPLLSTAARK